MTNSMESSTSTRGAIHVVSRSFIYLTVVLACVTEASAIALAFRYRELGINAIIAYTFPLLVLLPGLEGIRTYRQIKTSLLTNDQTKPVPEGISQGLTITIGVAYVALIFVLGLFVSFLHPRGQFF